MYIKDSRAFFGASALILTGGILSIMSYQYFAGHYTEEAIGRSRSWWEVAMNIQVLALACMWFCYADVIRTNDRRRAQVMYVRMTFGLLAVSAPFFITLLSVWMGWFVTVPPVSVVENIIISMLVFYFLATLIPKLFAIQRRENALTFKLIWESLIPNSVSHTLPSLALVFVIGSDIVASTRHTYVWLPVLLYIQASIPYCTRGLARGSRPQQVEIR